MTAVDWCLSGTSARRLLGPQRRLDVTPPSIRMVSSDAQPGGSLLMQDPERLVPSGAARSNMGESVESDDVDLKAARQILLMRTLASRASRETSGGIRPKGGCSYARWPLAGASGPED